MRYLFTFLMIASLQATAQPALEFGANAGAVLPTLTSNTGYTISMGGDLVTGRFKRKLTPAFGVRTSLFFVRTKEQTLNSGYIMAPDIVTWTSIALPVSINYVTPLSGNCNFRLTAGAGPAGDFTGTSGNSELFLLTEATAGLMFNKKTTVGLKYTYPTGFFGPSGYTAFRVHALQLDAKIMIPRGRVISGKSQWERLKERNTDMAERHKKIKEEKRRAPGKGPHMEIGLSGGMSFTSNVDSYLPYNAAVSKNYPALMCIVNVHCDRKAKPYSFTFGARIGAQGSEVGLATTLGVKYETQGDATFRASLTLGPSIYFVSYGRNTGIQVNIPTELSIGTQISRRLYTGIKYLQPLLKTTETATNWSYVREYQYMQSIFLADLAVRIGGKY